MKQYLLQMENIHKRFPGVYALCGANLTLRTGEVHALVGENGAGKSTLINVLGGIHKMDEGSIFIEGKPTHINGVLDARDVGISIIHQELVLVPHLTVAENIFLNREPIKCGMIDYQILFSESQRFIDDLGLNLHAWQKVVGLTIAQQQMVEIVKAVSFQAKIIVMDEPTSSLSDKEIDALFHNIKKLKARGISIIYISHRLSELSQIADSVTVLRDGASVGTMAVADTNHDEIVRLMVGREMTNYYTRTHNKTGGTVLRVQGLCSNRVHNINFEIKAGEIAGFAGLVGAGRTETVKALLGFDEMTAGTIEVDGRAVRIRHPSEAYRLGIGYIPESRREEGVFPIQSLRFNTTIEVLEAFIRLLRVDFYKERSLVEEYISALSIKTSSQETLIQNLSGGNQQKAIIARWLATKPRLLIMDEPTRGIDVGAKAEIYALMNELAAQGIAILMISSELPEIINMSDFVVVMRNGAISKVLRQEELTQEEIMRHAVNI